MTRASVVIGGGLRGLAIADSLYREGAEVIVIVTAAHLATEVLDPAAAAFLAAVVRRAGVAVVFEPGPIGRLGVPGDHTVVLDDGTAIRAAVVVDAPTEPVRTDALTFRAPGTRVFAYGVHQAAPSGARQALVADSVSGEYQRIAMTENRIASAVLIGSTTALPDISLLIDHPAPLPADPAELLQPPLGSPLLRKEGHMTVTPRKRLVVAGHGMVGHRLLERLAERGAAADWDVTVLAEEARPAYDRVHLSALFDGTTPAELSLAADGAFFTENGITLHLASAASSIDRRAKTVATVTGETVPYDTLVLATGSAPFVPPVPGRDLTGCFVYRTVEDVEQITEYAAGCRSGIVVGGGLLGLEAAGALVKLGLATSVVEFAPRLMPVQVDDDGAAALRRTIEAMGVVVHTSTRTEEVLGADGAVRGMRVETASGPVELDTDLVVFAAGIRPRDQLARDCGLPVGERGGITVDRWCRTEDPAVYAIGECAQAADGKVYGLVAPGYRMAETAADAIAAPAEAAPFEGADTSTKLKLLGVDVASFGDAFAVTPGAHTSVFADSAANVFKKLVTTAEGHLLGGILVGDASAYDALRPFTGAAMPLPKARERYLLPAGLAGADDDGPTALPPTAIVCSCHNVPQATITGAILDKSCTDVAALKACTKAGTGCGSCVPLLKSIIERELTAAGIEVDHSLCEHFKHTRAELVEIVRAKRITTFQRLIAEHGTGRGCDLCKPAVASILASLDGELGGPGHILDRSQAALQDTNDHFLANLQRNGSYSVVPRIPGGEITPEKLLVIGEVARDFGLYTKITGGQRIDLFGARVDQLPAIWARLVEAGFESGHAYGKALRTVKSCVGSTWCRYGVQDSVRLAIDLELRYRGLRSPHKLKSAVSGCARECAEARSKDFGIIATERGWNLYVGGNGGFTPRHADLLAEDLDERRLLQVIDRFLMFYIRTADRLERTAPWIERMEGGLDHLRAVVLDDSLGICADLEAAMAAHIASYRDEWGAVLDDPEKLRRFVSFVNAPDLPDPSIAFETERHQIKPLMTIGRRVEAVEASV